LLVSLARASGCLANAGFGSFVQRDSDCVTTL
jgi:hypothetical protein